MNNEELTKIAWTRELTNERVRVAAAYWLDCSPHERTEADGIILARYARMAMEKLELAAKALEYYADEKNHKWTEKSELAVSTLEEIKRLGEGVNK